MLPRSADAPRFASRFSMSGRAMQPLSKRHPGASWSWTAAGIPEPTSATVTIPERGLWFPTSEAGASGA